MKRVIVSQEEQQIKVLDVHNARQVEEIDTVVAENYDSDSFTCVEICDLLSTMYTNLRPAEVEYMYRDGGLASGGHVVCEVKGTSFLIDPTGDQFIKNSDFRTWIYAKQDFGYFSKDHKPYFAKIPNKYDNPVEFISEQSDDIWWISV